ncbi:MAG: outer membrane protein assembly factor BamD [candidate division Zixibacteria bacterium]|nr:outer membrane protein assembly factor BamD [candidate division Zixibacteria bacterium]
MRYFVALMALLVIIGCAKKQRQVLPAQEQFSYAKELFDKGKYYDAQMEFENLIYTYPGNTVIDAAQFYLGMCYFKRKDYGLGAGEFKRLLSAYPQSDFADDSQFQVGMCHFNMSPKYSLDQAETYIAIDEFNQLFSNFPTSSFIPEAKEKVMELNYKLAKKSFMSGKLYLKMKDNKSALTYFSFVRDNFPATDWAIQAFYYTGEAQMNSGMFDEAMQTLDSFLVGFSDHELASKARSKLEKLNEQASTSED